MIVPATELPGCCVKTSWLAAAGLTVMSFVEPLIGDVNVSVAVIV